MTDSDREEFGSHIEALAAAFKTKASKPLYMAYWFGLQDLPMEAIRQACTKALVECKFMPVPRELRDLAGVMGADQRAIVAWNSVKQAIREVGSYRSVSFDDPTINAAIRSLGGWPRVCGTDSEELDKWTSKEFQRLYCRLSALPLGQDLTRYLVGVFEASGHETLPDKPRQIRTGTGLAKRLNGAGGAPPELEGPSLDPEDK